MSKFKEYQDIKTLEGLSMLVNDTESDFKAEIVAAELIEDGYDPDQIFITRAGDSSRGYAKDIEKIYLQFSQQDLRDHLYILTNKASIYDILPEGLFHQPIRQRSVKDKEDILEEIKIHRNEEFFARKFFQLFEFEADRMLTEAYLYESKYEKKVTNPNFVNIFIPYWPVLKLLTREQAIRFLHIIPILHKIRNKYKEIAEAISMVLDTPVKIENIKLPAKDANDFFESVIGENYLGIDWVLGKSFDDGIYDLKMTIGPLPASDMPYFLRTNLGDTVLNTLCQIFIPADIFVVKEFKIAPEDASFILSDDSTMAYMGINTFI